MIEGFTEEARQCCFYYIDKANLVNKRQVVVEFKSVIPDEYLYQSLSFLKSKLKKLGYKVRQLNTKLKVEW